VSEIQTDPALEARMGFDDRVQCADIYIHPETYDHVITLDPPLPARPGCLIVECDRWKAWIWLGETWARKRDAGLPRIGFRRKVPYSRLKPQAIIERGGIEILGYEDRPGHLAYTIDYHDAVDSGLAAKICEDPRDLYVSREVVPPVIRDDGAVETYESLRRRAEARVAELNA